MKKLKILCPFCNAPYTAEMLIELDSSISGCESCAMSEASVVVEIECTNCLRTVYKKEGKQYD